MESDLVVPEALRLFWERVVREEEWRWFYNVFLKPALWRGKITEKDIEEIAVLNGFEVKQCQYIIR